MFKITSDANSMTKNYDNLWVVLGGNCFSKNEKLKYHSFSFIQDNVRTFPGKKNLLYFLRASVDLPRDISRDKAV